jgi:hypothetical protein
MERIIDAGYHPQFGARALKRAIEKQLMQPVAASLAGVKPELPAVINVYPSSSGVTASVQALESVAPSLSPLFDELVLQAKLERVERFLERMAHVVENSRPEVDSRGISPEQIRYFALKEQWHRTRELHQALQHSLQLREQVPKRPDVAPRTPSYGKRLSGIVRSHRAVSARGVLRELHTASDIHEYLREAVAAIPKLEESDLRLVELRQEASLLESLQATASSPEQVALVIHPLSVPAREFGRTLLQLREVFADELSFSCQVLPGSTNELGGLRIAGPGAGPLAQLEAGVHMYCRQQENLLPVQVTVMPLQPNVNPLAEFRQRRAAWLASLRDGAAAIADDPWPLGRVVRFYDEGGSTLDVRTGHSLARFPKADQWKRLLLDGLPLPAELEAEPCT